MKTVYFVRHGEAEVNVSETFGAEDSPLTEKGRTQAQAIAERCAQLPLETMVVSTMARAQETASIISNRIHLPITSSDLFKERRRPMSLVGKRHDDKQAEQLHGQWTDGFFSENLHVEDGENFSDLKERASKILSFLEAQPESHILVVMHGFIMRMIFAHIIFGETLSASEFYKLVRAVRSVENAGITVALYDPSQERTKVYPRAKWSVQIWNDHAHLG